MREGSGSSNASSSPSERICASVAEHLFRPGDAGGLGDRLGNEQPPAEPQCLPRLVQRSAVVLGFDDDGDIGHQSHRPIASGKVSACRRRTGSKLRNAQMLLHDPVLQSRVLLRVDAIQGRAKHGDRMATGVDRRSMSGRVDPFGQTTDDNHASLDEQFGQLACPLNSLWAGLAGADYRHPRPALQQAHVAGDVELLRCVFFLDLVQGAEKLLRADGLKFHGRSGEEKSAALPAPQRTPSEWRPRDTSSFARRPCCGSCGSSAVFQAD